MYQDILFPKGMVARRSLLHLLCFFVLAGCGESGSDSDSISSGLFSSKNPKVTLAVNAAKIKMNDDISLSWNSDNVNTCVASGAWSGNKEITGTQLVKVLSGKTRFTITCSGDEGNSSDTIEVVGSGAVPGVPAINLSASLTSIPYNGSTTLFWDSTNTIDCDASGGWSGSKTTSGSMVIDALTSNTSFSLSCSGVGGSVTDEISITVAPPVVPLPVTAPVVNLSASPLTVAYNGTTQLSWTTNNSDNCVASGDWSGSKSLSGSRTKSNLTANKTYILTCTGAGGTTIDSLTIAVREPAPALSLSASANTVEQNGSTTLNWNSSDATSCTASGDWSGSKNLSGSEILSNLTTDKIYTLTCSGAGGTSIDSLTITVGEPAPMLSLSASANTVEQNGSTTLNWNSSDATSCTASGDWSGSKNLSGSEILSNLTTDKIYTLTCSGAGGTSIDSLTIAVGEPAPVLSLSASANTVEQNGSTTLNWNSSDATSCTASGDWSGSKNLSGSEILSNLTTDKIYTLTCSGAGGTSIDSLTITVGEPAPMLSLSASANTVEQNGSTTLNWSSSDATSCTASGDWSGSKNLSGSEILSNLTTDKIYTLTCSGAGGTSIDSLTIAVREPAPALSLSASANTVEQNGSTTLNWNSSDATSCTASGDWSGSKPASGSQVVSGLTIDSQFNLVCSGAGGSVNDSVSVSVVLNSNGTALLSWMPPTENTDGSQLADLAGYRIHYGTSAGNYSDTIDIDTPGLSSYLIENLASSTWYFSMTAVNSSGVESTFSTEVSKTIN